MNNHNFALNYTAMSKRPILLCQFDLFLYVETLSLSYSQLRILILNEIWYIEIIIIIIHQTVFAMSKRPILPCRIDLFCDLF